eukprot:GHVQ01003712.1.p1 GENE.GHVQ01003712.1~~GHVQ01003712.1.p1  ORF type:complete len:583 (-),score=106.51 GHVQ01003712.1:1048-2796(-)
MSPVVSYPFPDEASALDMTPLSIPPSDLASQRNFLPPSRLCARALQSTYLQLDRNLTLPQYQQRLRSYATRPNRGATRPTHLGVDTHENSEENQARGDVALGIAPMGRSVDSTSSSRTYDISKEVGDRSSPATQPPFSSTTDCIPCAGISRVEDIPPLPLVAVNLSCRGGETVAVSGCGEVSGAARPRNKWGEKRQGSRARSVTLSPEAAQALWDNVTRAEQEHLAGGEEEGDMRGIERDGFVERGGGGSVADMLEGLCMDGSSSSEKGSDEDERKSEEGQETQEDGADEDKRENKSVVGRGAKDSGGEVKGEELVGGAGGVGSMVGGWFKRLHSLIGDAFTKVTYSPGKLLGKTSHKDMYGGMAMLTGCTACTVIVTQNEIVVANAGDSRAVLCRGDKAIALSKDHKPQLPEERVRIYAAGGYLEMGRVNGNLNLSRALGDLVYKQDSSLPPQKQIVTAAPDVLAVTIDEVRDEFLIIGCDGIWEFLSCQDVVDFIRERIDTSANLSDILKELFDELISPNPALFEFGCDNMSAIIVDLKPSLRSAFANGGLSSTPNTILSTTTSFLSTHTSPQGSPRVDS